MYIKRKITEALKKAATQFPVVALTGPRQSGKSTLAKHVFSEYAYVSLENLDIREAAQKDPRHFLESHAHKKGVIIDEIQEVPELFSYMQEIVDREYRPGFFVVTGSQNFLLHEKTTQTLAGRIALLTLLPLSIDELQEAHLLPKSLDAFMLKGSYPSLYSKPFDSETWFRNYIATYVEKDVRSVLNIGNVVAFQKFLRLCAARVGMLLNYTDIARDCDIAPNTAKSWIAILEASYLIKLITPYYRNYNKRIIKTPKLYFYDTGLVCALLGIKSEDALSISPMRGPLFESLMISELFKYSTNRNQSPQLYFWRDVQGHEIDCIIEKSYNTIIPFEIKSSATVSANFFKGLADWQDITGQKELFAYVLYAGQENMVRTQGTAVGWKNLTDLLESL